MTKLSRNILYNVAGQLLLLGLGFVASRFVFRRLGEDAFGIIYFNLAMSAFLSLLFDLGLSSTLVREISRAGPGKTQYVERLVRTSGLVYWVLYLALAAAVHFAAPVLVGRWLHLQSISPDTAARMLGLLGAGSLLSLPRSLYTSLFRARQRMAVNNAIDVSVSAVQQVGTIVLLERGASAVAVSAWLSGCFAAGILLYGGLAGRLYSWRALVPGLDPDVVRRNFRFSLRMTGMSLLTAVHTQADKAIVSRLLPLGTFGVYGFLTSIVSKATLLGNAVAQSALPVFSELSSPDGRAELHLKYRKLQDLLCLSSVPLLAAVPFAVPPLFTLLFGAPIASEMTLPATLLAVGFYMNATIQIPYAISLAVGMPGIMLRFNLLALFIVLPAQALLIRSMGLTGAGLSWIVYHLLAYAVAVPALCRNCLDLPYSRWLGQVLRIAGASGTVYGGAWLLLRASGRASDLWWSALACGVATAVWTPMMWVLAGPELRSSCRALAGGSGPAKA